MNPPSGPSAPTTPPPPPTGGAASRWDAFFARAGKALASRHLTIAAGALVILAQVLVCSPVWRPHPDSALYMDLAAALANGEGYTYQGRPHAHGLPGLPVLLAGAMRLGLDRDWQINATMSFLFLVMCGAIWFLTHLLTGRAAANLALILVGLNPHLIFWSRFVLTEVPYILLMVTAAICLTLAWRSGRLSLPLVLGGALAGAAAVLTRPNGVALLPAFVLWGLLTAPGSAGLRKRALLIGILCAAGLALSAWWVARSRAYGRAEASSYYAIAGNKVGWKAANYPLRLGRMSLSAVKVIGGTEVDHGIGRIGSYILGAIGLAAALGGAVLLLRRREVLLPALLAGHFLLLGLGEPKTRYLVSVLPLAVVTGLVAGVHFARRAGAIWKTAAAVVLAVFLVQTYVGALEGVGAVVSPQDEDSTKKAFKPYLFLGEKLAERGEPVRVYTSAGRILHHYSGRLASTWALSENAPASAFPAEYARRGGADLLAFDPRFYPQDTAIEAEALRMEKEGAFRLRRRTDTVRVIAYEVLPPVAKPE